MLLALQPLAPFGSALEGTLLGSLEIPHVAIRTIFSAAISCGFLSWANANHLGLAGVWLGLLLVIFCNMLTDAWKVTSSSSPFKKVAEAKVADKRKR